MITVPHIKYTDGWKYMLYEPLVYQLSERFTGIPSCKVHEGEIDGSTRTITIYVDYPWDGASGPTIDTKDSIVPSTIHDFLYELLRQQMLGQEWREKADLEFYDLMIACIDMSDTNNFIKAFKRTRAYTWYYAVRWGAVSAAKPGSERKVLEAP